MNLREAVLVVAQPRREALIEVAGGGMQRAIQCALMPSKDVARLHGNTPVDVDRLESALRREAQPDFGRAGHDHSGPPL